MGLTTGGFQVVIRGSNLTGASAVYFGTTAAQIMGVSATAIGVVVPAHAAGVVDVTVVTPAGTSAVAAADQFTYMSGAPSQAAAVDAVMAGWSPPTAPPQPIDALLAEILSGSAPGYGGYFAKKYPMG
jgi:hypothetical protein